MLTPFVVSVVIILMVSQGFFGKLPTFDELENPEPTCAGLTTDNLFLVLVDSDELAEPPARFAARELEEGYVGVALNLREGVQVRNRVVVIRAFEN